MKKFYVLTWLCLVPCLLSAEEYKDPATNVVYTYDPAGSTAEVKRGEFIDWESGARYYSGSPEAKGDIAILEKFSVDGHDYEVTRIGNYAFVLSQEMTSVVLPPTVTSIGDKAFAGCTALSSVKMTEQLKEIGYGAFVGCSSLKAISFPEGLESIGFEAFITCTGLESVVFPASLKTLGEMSFMYCNALSTIVVRQGNAKFDSRDGCNAIIETATNKMILGCKGTTFPPSVTAIGTKAFFQCQGLESVYIPGSIKEIGESAFQYCENLKEVTLSEGLKTIGYGAFWYASMTTLTIPSTVTQIAPCALWLPTLKSVTSLIEEPIGIDEICDFDHHQIKLYVPVGTKSKYESLANWSRFSPIEELEEQAGVRSSTITSQPISLYDLQGRRLTTQPRRGIYVKDGKKVVVK